MVKILLRADDLGYSEAVNYGIEKSVRDGLIKSVGVMVNMPATKHGVDLLKKYTIAFGLHTNICAGKPLTNPDHIPSLVDCHGYFKSSAIYRNAVTDFVNFDEAVLEIKAQYQRFIELFQRKPDYFEGHAVTSNTFFEALKAVAKMYDLKYSGYSFGGDPITIGNSLVTFHMESMNDNYNPERMLRQMVEGADEKIVQLGIFHPGYLDDYLLTHSSLTFPRTKEVAMLTDNKIKKWLSNQEVDLIDYRNL
ncbi:ChbG/HpnK family deacetylase [Streptococcus dentiloxodontae]